MEVDASNLNQCEVSLRPMFSKLNAHTRSDGSAMVTQGKYINYLFIIQSNHLIKKNVFNFRRNRSHSRYFRTN